MKEHWNYRVVRHKKDGYEWLAFHEVYYDGKGKPVSMSKEPVVLETETVEEFKEMFTVMRAALKKPVFEPPEKWG